MLKISVKPASKGVTKSVCNMQEFPKNQSNKPMQTTVLTSFLQIKCTHAIDLCHLKQWIYNTDRNTLSPCSANPPPPPPPPPPTECLLVLDTINDYYGQYATYTFICCLRSVLLLIIVHSHLLWWKRCQCYIKCRTNNYLLKFWTMNRSFEPSLWPWPWTQQSNLFTRHSCLWWHTIKVWLQKDQHHCGYSRNDHILIYEPSLWRWPWRQQNSSFIWHSGSWWCTITQCLVTKG